MPNKHSDINYLYSLMAMTLLSVIVAGVDKPFVTQEQRYYDREFAGITENY